MKKSTKQNEKSSLTTSNFPRRSLTSKKTLLSKNVCLCSSFWKKGTGLMFRKKRSDFAFIFPFKKSQSFHITMFFVFFPIDILLLDADGVILDLKENLCPFRNYFFPKKAFTFIELPRGFIKKFSLSRGDRIVWSKKSCFLRR